MSKTLAAIGLFFLAGIATAEPVPKTLQKSLTAYQVNAVGLNDGTLNITTTREIVTTEIYRNIVFWGVCFPLWKSAQAWGTAEIEHIEVRNVYALQGFAFQGGRKECSELQIGSRDEANAYIDARTFVCVAGNECRPRRIGERIAGE